VLAEATAGHDGWVEQVEAVCGSDDEDALGGLEPVQFSQQLVQGRVIAPAGAILAAGRRDGVDLIR